MEYQIAFTAVSRNEKTGPMPVTTTEQATCPPSCPFNSREGGGGCYAEAGPLALFWRKVGERKAGLSWADAMGKIAALPKGTLWRHNQAGDLPGQGEAIDHLAMGQLVNANKGKRGFTYTHKDMTREANRHAVQWANEAGLTVNLSANNLAHADDLASLGIGPVVTVLPIDFARRAGKGGQWLESLAEYRARVGKSATPDNRPVTICPATYRDDINCQRCGLCAVAKRRAIVGFPAHGAAKRKADAIADARPAVGVGA
jgi:hypothetical protein